VRGGLESKLICGEYTTKLHAPPGNVVDGRQKLSEWPQINSEPKTAGWKKRKIHEGDGETQQQRVTGMNRETSDQGERDLEFDDTKYRAAQRCSRKGLKPKGSSTGVGRGPE